MTSKIIKNHLRNLRIDAKNCTKTLNEETQKKLDKAKQKKLMKLLDSSKNARLPKTQQHKN